MSLPRLLAGVHPDRPLSHAEHLAAHGPPGSRGRVLAAEVERAGLRGRGGAAFPTAIKLRSVAGRRGSRVVVVNAAEGEPMSAKDRVLLTLAPHLVLDGALAAADAIGARRIVVAVPRDANASASAVNGAVAERSLGRRVQVRAVPVVYLAGEETALIRHLDGGPLRPTVVPPLPSERGLGRRPTLVQNAETLAHLALIARHGADWYRRVGSDADPGSTLVTIGGAVARPGVVEIARGERLIEVLAAAGAATESLRAVLVGGYHGAWIDARQLAAVTLDDAGLGEIGASLATGVIVALDASACPVQEVARTVWWLAEQSAGQCGPCANGLSAVAMLLRTVGQGRAGAGAFQRLERWRHQLPGRGACHLPDGAMRFLASGLDTFLEEFERHHRHGPCAACARPTTLVAAPHGQAVA